MPPRHRLPSFSCARPLVAVFLIAIGAVSSGAKTLVVTVRDIRSSEGEIRNALNYSAEDFLVDGRTAATRPTCCSAGSRKPS